MTSRPSFGTNAALAIAALWAAAAFPCSASTVELVPSPASDYRWRDIATNLYSQSYRDTYVYDDASVVVEFVQCQDTLFAGHLAAAELKPNFAYQVKLVGKPEGVWGADGDDLTNERIGYAGRWWRVTPNPGNSSDADYEAHKDDPDYIYEGYLVFDFFATDRFGAAGLDFASSSSYHVLWWEDQRTGGPCDSPVKWSTVVGYAGDPAYDEDVGPSDVGVYGEIERLCFGETTLPAGVYNCRFALTEESFHQSGEGEGAWATVLVCDTLHFEIDCGAGVAGGVEDVPAAARRMGPSPFRDRSSLEFALARPGRAALLICDVRGRMIRRLDAGRLGPGLHELTWDGTDSRGRRAVEGVYIYSLTVGGRNRTVGKVVLLY